MKNQFRETRNIFVTALNYDVENPLSYHDWLKYPDDDKAAVLFLAFFDQITLAWEKAKSFYTPTEDAVSIVLQYLQKNVDKIKSDEKKYTPRYLYRVAYNCIYCECHDKQWTQNQYKYEVSEHIDTSNGESFSHYDIVPGSTLDSEYESRIYEEMASEFWGIVEDMDVDAQLIIEKLIGTPYDAVIEMFEVENDTLPRLCKSKVSEVSEALQAKLLARGFSLDEFMNYV